MPAITGTRPARVLDRRLDQLAVLVDVDRRRLAGGADDDDPGGAARDVEVDQPAERGKIERAAFLHGCRDGDETAGQHGGRTEEKGRFYPIHPTAGRGDAGQAPGTPTPRRAPAATAARRPTAASRWTTACRSGVAHMPLLERDGDEPAGDTLQQLAGLEQKIRIRRPAVGLVAAGEGLVEQHAVVGQRREQLRQQRPMQIVDDDDRVEAFAAEDRTSAFEVQRARLDARLAGERRERGRVAIDGDDVAAARGEEARMAAVAAGDVEHPRARRDQRRRSARSTARAARRARAADGWFRRCIASASRVVRAPGAGRRAATSAASAAATSAAASSASHATKLATSARSTACGATIA